MLSLPFGRKLAAAVLLVLLVHASIGAAIEDQPSHQTLQDNEESKLSSLLDRRLRIYRNWESAESRLRHGPPAGEDPTTNDNTSKRPKRSFPTTSQREVVCSRYLDHFAPEYNCVSTATEFIMQLMDVKVTSILLCNKFVYTPTTTLNLSEQTKMVICQGGNKNCVIDGSLFNPIEESAFIASGFASLFFCGVDFVNFFDMQTRVFALDGESIHADFESCEFRNNGFSVATETQPGGGGGVMTISRATAYFSACTFHGNHAPRGGVIDAINAAKVFVEDSDVEDNVGLVGGVMTISSNVKATFNNCNIRDGMARYGGVVYVADGTGGGATLKFSGSDIRGNRVSQNGGVVYIENTPWSPVSFDDCTIDSNKADGMGGVLYASGGSVCAFSSCDVQGNRAGAQGGALYVEQDSSVVLSESSFVSNRAFASLKGVLVEHQGGAAMNGGDHIFVASTDDVELVVECSSTGDNVFADPSDSVCF